MLPNILIMNDSAASPYCPTNEQVNKANFVSLKQLPVDEMYRSSDNLTDKIEVQKNFLTASVQIQMVLKKN